MIIATLITSSICCILLLILLYHRDSSSSFKLLEPRLKQITEQNAMLQTHLTEHLMKSFDLLRGQIVDTLKYNAEQTDKQVAKLTDLTDQRLKEINAQVEKRLAEGFEKTTATFQDVIKRLALIDQAQQKITELSGNVISLQQVLADKRTRGAFGEVQLNGLVQNVMPEQNYKFQYTLPNNTRVDCAIFLPNPTGTICIDAKFPLENYQKMMDIHLSESEKTLASRQFKLDIKKHITDISDKYIIPGETSDGAIMFIPAEAVFAEIHGHHPDLVQQAQQAKVWICSPTTLMAILTTASAAIKDDATRKQIHIIQQHLVDLGKDFDRFQIRMGKLAKHIEQAHQDVGDVHTSAKKITSRFEKIENVELRTEPFEKISN